MTWRPQPGPQTAFCAASEFEVLYGGAAGGGKTDALLYDPLDTMAHPGARALFLRQTFPELREVMDRAHATFSQHATWNGESRRWTFRSGATYEFGYCATWADVQRYQGQQYTAIAFDEIGNLAEERVWLFLLARLRSTSPALRVRARCSANPGGPGHAWLRRRFVDPTEGGRLVYRDPTTGLMRRFIPARLTDNPALLRANPHYAAQLEGLPELLRRQLLDGDWSAGMGLALEELDAAQHLVRPFPIPGHWTRWGGFDWGYSHPWVFVGSAADGDGNAYVTHVVRGRRQYPDQIAAKILEAISENGHPPKLQTVAAGHDCWHDVRARGDLGPTVAERLYAAGLLMDRANISRVSGLQNLRQYLSWRGRDRPPALQIFDTPGGRWLFQQLSGLVLDPDSTEDVLKVDADRDTGEGGDDGYDALRYGMMVRPYQPRKAESADWLIPDRSENRDHDAVRLQRLAERYAGRRMPLPEDWMPEQGGGGQWLGY